MARLHVTECSRSMPAAELARPCTSVPPQLLLCSSWVLFFSVFFVRDFRSLCVSCFRARCGVLPVFCFFVLRACFSFRVFRLVLCTLWCFSCVLFFCSSCVIFVPCVSLGFVQSVFVIPVLAFVSKYLLSILAALSAFNKSWNGCIFYLQPRVSLASASG